jgi:hypothetical protein
MTEITYVEANGALHKLAVAPRLSPIEGLAVRMPAS